MLNAVQSRQYKRHRFEGGELSPAEWMKSTLLTERQKRCLTRGWTRRHARLGKKAGNRLTYLKFRVGQLEERLEETSRCTSRLRKCLLGNVGDLLWDENKDDGEGVAADGPGAAEDGEGAKVSPTQKARLYAQTVAVLDVTEEENVRDQLILEHNKQALEVLEQAHNAASSPAQIKAADELAGELLETASVVRFQNSLLLIAEKAAETAERRFSPETLLAWRRQFRKLGAFLRDGRGVREREWILNEEDLSMELLNWLKAQKRVTTKTTHKFVNEVLLAREGGVLRLAKYGLSLPISTTTINVWMRKLGCKHDRVKQSYYSDGHERPDVQAAREVYLRLQRKLALRKPCWVRVEWSSLTEEEKQGFNDQRETGDDAFSAETFHFEMGGEEYVEFHVDFLGAGSDEKYDALREGLGSEGGSYSIRFDIAAAAPCEYFHAPDVCRCRQPLYHIGQDESVYKAYARQGTEWVIRGVRGLRKKTEGAGEMVSAFQDEKRGFGLPLSVGELATVNSNREGEGRPALEDTPGWRFLLPGKNREGYWGFADFEKQTVDIMDCIEEIEPGKQIAIEVDHSAGHAKYLPEGLHVANMNVKHGGKQKVPRDSVMTEGCLGPGKAEMFLSGDKWSTKKPAGALTTRVVDLKLKLGDVQRMSFGPTDPPPFYDWEAPPKDKRVQRRGKLEQKEGYVGKAKGIKQVLWERGWYVDGMSATSKDVQMNLELVLGGLPDFKNERTALQHTVEKRGHILVMSPKFHPEVAGVGIEYSWGMSKLKFRRELNDEIPKHLHQNIVASMNRESILTLPRVRRFARRTRDYCRAYLRLQKVPEGAESKDSIERMRKTCKAHRNIIDMEPGFIDKQ